MIEEKVIQPESVAPAEQPVAETNPPTPQPAAPNLDSLKAEYETQIATLKTQLSETEDKFKGIKGKLDEVYQKQDDQRKRPSKTKASGKTCGKKQTKQPKQKSKKY